MRSFASAILTLVVALGSGHGRAQDACVVESPEPDELQLSPAPGSPAPVPLDSPLLARFAPGIDVSEFEGAELLRLFERVDGDGAPRPVAGRYERFAAQPNVLAFRPEGGLRAGARYLGRAFDPLDASERELSFEAAERSDERPPGFASTARLSLRSAARAADCQGARVDVRFPPALDDGPRGSIEHLVYQTRGASLSAPQLRSRVRATMGTEVSTSFVLDGKQSDQPLCVAVLPIDGTGRVGKALGPSCFSPQSAPRFVGPCAASPPAVAPAWLMLWWLGVALALTWRRLRDDERT